jgi:hypothetical protein
VRSFEQGWDKSRDGINVLEPSQLTFFFSLAYRGDDWEVITDYNRWGPLVSKGPTGGTYRYVDNTADVGGWVYRISEVEKDGNESDLCQCLVEVQSKGEKLQGIVAAVGIAAIAIGGVIAGITLDPIQ